MTDCNKIFIQSVPRSGSSWLLSIFNSHKKTKCLYQPLFSYEFKNRIDENSTVDDFNKFIGDINNTSDDFCTMNSSYHTNNGKNKKTICDKYDINYTVVKHVSHNYLFETFIKLDPNIKIIALIRNPIDVISSQINAGHEKLQDWLNGDDKNNGIIENDFGFNKWLEIKNLYMKTKEKYPDNIYIVNYEDLVENTYNTIENIFLFCGMTLDNDTKEYIDITTSPENHENYDYSVFKNKKTKNKKDINNEIKKYIKNNS